MHASRPKSVEALVEKLGFARELHFICFIILHFLAKHLIPEPHTHPKAWECYTSQEPIKRGISLFYRTGKGINSCRPVCQHLTGYFNIFTYTVDQSLKFHWVYLH